MARPIERGLRRTVGVAGLFATAYGNVGSSTYYALGLVAAHALRLTPLVFILAGGLFALTARPTPRARRCSPRQAARRRSRATRSTR
jgi:APA family basic amino acid/polyamine antiporter